MQNQHLSDGWVGCRAHLWPAAAHNDTGLPASRCASVRHDFIQRRRRRVGGRRSEQERNSPMRLVSRFNCVQQPRGKRKRNSCQTLSKLQESFVQKSRVTAMASEACPVAAAAIQNRNSKGGELMACAHGKWALPFGQPKPILSAANNFEGDRCWCRLLLLTPPPPPLLLSGSRVSFFMSQCACLRCWFPDLELAATADTQRATFDRKAAGIFPKSHQSIVCQLRAERKKNS